MKLADKWKRVALSEVCKTTSGGTPSRSKSDYYGGTVPWVKSGELEDYFIYTTEETITDEAVQKSSAKIFPEGTLLIALYGATVGKLGILKLDAATNQAVCAIFPGENIDRDYLYFYLLSQRASLIESGAGGAQPNISQDIIRRLEIPLPPLEEQRRIAAIARKCDHLRRTRRFTQQLSNTYLQSVFLKMFGDPLTNPKQWEIGKLSDLGILDRGVSKHRPRNDPKLLGGIYPLVQTGDVSNSQGYIKSYKQTYSQLGIEQSKIWPRGTLCITIAANIAKTGVLTFDACFPDSVVGFTPNEKANTEFIQCWFSFLQKILEEIAPESAQKNINLEILRNLDIIIPPMQLQEKFASVVSRHERLRTQQREAERQAEHLFQTVLHRAFRGEL